MCSVLSSKLIWQNIDHFKDIFIYEMTCYGEWSLVAIIYKHKGAYSLMFDVGSNHLRETKICHTFLLNLISLWRKATKDKGFIRVISPKLSINKLIQPINMRLFGKDSDRVD